MRITNKGKMAVIGILSILLVACWCYYVRSAPSDILSEEIITFELSPDGKQIAFVDKQGLKVAQISGGKSRLLVKLPFLPEQLDPDVFWSTYHGINIAWSPNGKKIAVTADFLSERQSKLMIVDPANGDMHVIHRSAFHSEIAWSPDSNHLACVSLDSSIKKSKGKYMVQMGHISLYVYSPAETKSIARKIFTKPELGNGGSSTLAWLPSGDIAFTYSAFQFGLVRPDGSNLRTLPAANKPGNRTSRWLLEWAESPDGTQIAYTLAPKYDDRIKNPNIRLWTYRISDGHIQKVSDQYRPLDIAWSSDGQGIWFANSSPPIGIPPGMTFNTRPPHELHWISVDGKRHRKIRKENDGIRNIRCAKDGTVFYISGYRLRSVR